MLFEKDVFMFKGNRFISIMSDGRQPTAVDVILAISSLYGVYLYDLGDWSKYRTWLHIQFTRQHFTLTAAYAGPVLIFISLNSLESSTFTFKIFVMENSVQI